MKNRLIQAAAVVAGALAPWIACADPLASSVAKDKPQSVLLLKAPGDSLRFRWAARVGEAGQFVLAGPDGSEVWTAAHVGRSDYEAAPPALSGEYELRYRDASGHERVIAHVLVACVSLGRHAPLTVSGRPIPPKAEVAGPILASATAPLGAVIDSSRTGLAPFLGPPPTPPPRSLA
jgi:hypothetical protein